jgi:CheY-like chemotaxis protein
VRSTAVQALRVLGYRVLEAACGDEALRLLGQDADVQLLLTETTLPGGMDGAELAARAVAKRRRLRVLYTPGFAGNLRLRDLPAAADVLPKPYAISELARRIRAALDQESRDDP